MTRTLLFLANDASSFVSHRLPIAKAAITQGYCVHVAAPSDHDAATIICKAGADFHPIPLDRGSRNPFVEMHTVLFLWSLFGRLKPSVIHCIGMKSVLYGGMMARIRRVPSAVYAITGLGFMFLHDDISIRLARFLISVLYAFALRHKNARVIFQNSDDRRLFELNQLIGRTPVDMICGCGVDMTIFQPRSDRKLFDSDQPVVMFPARLIRDKGLDEFIDAAEVLRPDFPTVRFVLVGRTDLINPTSVTQSELQNWVDSGIVEWWGFSNDMATTLRQADMVVLPSYREGLPRSLIEAAATALPVVTTDVPGCRDVVRHGETGLLVPAYDGMATATAIRQLLNAPNQARAMGAIGREMAEAEFSVKTFVELSLASYTALEAPE